MAAVWRASDTVLNRPVAVKRLHAGLVSDAELIERFRREALLVARLSHPNLVHVLDRGEDADGPYLVLELVEGENLKARIRRDGPLTPDAAANICAQVAHALAYAHGQGVMHRDIKAQNVLLTGDGVAKLADFGIARMIEGEGDGGGLTRTDMLLGSADYLSPEQASGHALDARADIYSLGIVLYECLTATLPFTGDSFVAVAMKHCTQPLPDPRTARASVPDWLAAHTMRAAEKDPALRFPDAGAMAAALEAGPTAGDGTAIFPLPLPPPDAGAGSGGGEVDTATARRPRRASRRRKALMAVIGVVVAAAIAVGIGLAVTRDDGGPADPDTPTMGASVPLAISAVRDLDPPEGGGDGAEGTETRGLATDGDDTTAWYTERYEPPAEFGGLKDGVGLLLRIAQPAVATEAVVLSPTPGATFQILAGGPPGQGRVLAESTFTGERQTIPLSTAAATRNFVLWITALAPDETGRYHAGVGEVELRGVPEEMDAG